MATKIRFYPVGNGDSSQIILENGKRLLFDYRQVKSGEEEGSPTIDLATTLREELNDNDRDNFDVVAFTHGDDDHIAGSSDFFYLDHTKKYQGKDRIKISELWVPAAMIIEEGPTEEARTLRQEARHRLRKNYGIRVFSKPERLKEWLESEGLTVESRSHLISDAGTIVPGYTLKADQVEFFVHSPFIKHCDGSEDIARNESAIILHATFRILGKETRYFIIGDSTWDVLSDIVNITRGHKNYERLLWDIYNIPHHCSYNSLAEEKGKEVTIPHPDVAWLLDQGQTNALLVCSSIPVPNDNERKMPPHIQAKRTYDDIAGKKNAGSSVLVTGDSKDRYKNPTPIEIEISSDGCKRKLGPIGTASIVTSSRTADRAG